ncbi:deoxyribonuclease-2-beta-like [Tetranychus urticae]|uniref:Uncharacterized protein n=1 Tax=Tetranychus urticae TaxID=32264 RepID=T1JRZ4_TETUR|nr:deoxyribonuclease-2-beta-like [Tetranychus urticae]
MSAMFKLFYFFILFGCIVGPLTAISCKNEQDESVDWYIAYKLPREEPKPNQNGYNYATITSKDYKESKLKLSSKLVNDSGSIWGKTLAPLYADASKYTYFAWNDDPPKEKGNGYYAHSKGVIAMDATSGFWLIHSVPNFPNLFNETYDYPTTGRENAQISLCLSFASQLEGPKIGSILALMRPNVYAYNLIDTIPKENDNFQSLVPSSGRKRSRNRNTVLTSSLKGSSDGTQFTVFGKSPRALIEIYSDVIGPTLKSDLYTQTWRRGAGGILNSTCSRKTVNVMNVQSISMKFKNDTETDDWDFTSDHSKWAITTDADNSETSSEKNPWTCVGDINRMQSQSKRGGSVVCLKNQQLWSAFNKIIKSTEACNQRTRKNSSTRKPKAKRFFFDST